jgi:beta-lactamase regulating signal transducer with metallopeptidase domain
MQVETISDTLNIVYLVGGGILALATYLLKAYLDRHTREIVEEKAKEYDRKLEEAIRKIDVKISSNRIEISKSEENMKAFCNSKLESYITEVQFEKRINEIVVQLTQIVSAIKSIDNKLNESCEIKPKRG